MKVHIVSPNLSFYKERVSNRLQYIHMLFYKITSFTIDEVGFLVSSLRLWTIWWVTFINMISRDCPFSCVYSAQNIHKTQIMSRGYETDNYIHCWNLVNLNGLCLLWEVYCMSEITSRCVCSVIVRVKLYREGCIISLMLFWQVIWLS